MDDTGIAGRARFDIIRYAQVWEDADVLVAAMGPGAGRRFLSVCSAGDNALALLLLDPREVVAADLSATQLECLKLRLAAIAVLDHPEFLELMGARPSGRRAALLRRATSGMESGPAALWSSLEEGIVRHGAGGVGKFERYFRIFRRAVLPLIHSRRTVEGVFEPRDEAGRRDFFDRRWDGWRWRTATGLFFSRTVMGRLGRDPAFFDHVGGSPGEHVRWKVRYAATVQDPSANPYMHWILAGTHGRELPLAWRESSYATLRERAGRITAVLGPVDTAAAGPFDGFNLSDIFEYMTPGEAEAAYGRLLALAAPGGRLVYWNMMVPRRVPAALAGKVRRLVEAERDLAARDKAFFYSDLVVEEALP